MKIAGIDVDALSCRLRLPSQNTSVGGVVQPSVCVGCVEYARGSSMAQPTRKVAGCEAQNEVCNRSGPYDYLMYVQHPAL